MRSSPTAPHPDSKLRLDADDKGGGDKYEISRAARNAGRKASCRSAIPIRRVIIKSGEKMRDWGLSWKP